VSTAVLLFTRGARTENIWFYDMAHDGFSLDDKRVKAAENDIPDVIACWKKRFDASFLENRNSRIEELRALLAPLKAERLESQAEINRLQFEAVLAPPDLRSPSPNSTEVPSNLGRAGEGLSDAQARLADLQSQIQNPQSELDRLTRQFWVTKAQVCKGGASLRPNYDLSASRYRQVDADAAYHEQPVVTLERLARLEELMASEINEIAKLLK
jgi:type I restriction enzyme M protein